MNSLKINRALPPFPSRFVCTVKFGLCLYAVLLVDLVVGNVWSNLVAGALVCKNPKEPADRRHGRKGTGHVQHHLSSASGSLPTF